MYKDPVYVPQCPKPLVECNSNGEDGLPCPLPSDPNAQWYLTERGNVCMTQEQAELRERLRQNPDIIPSMLLQQRLQSSEDPFLEQANRAYIQHIFDVLQLEADSESPDACPSCSTRIQQLKEELATLHDSIMQHLTQQTTTPAPVPKQQQRHIADLQRTLAAEQQSRENLQKELDSIKRKVQETPQHSPVTRQMRREIEKQKARIAELEQRQVKKDAIIQAAKLQLRKLTIKPVMKSVTTQASEPEKVTSGTQASEPEKVTSGTQASEPEKVTSGTQASEPGKVASGTQASESEKVASGTQASGPCKVECGAHLQDILDTAKQLAATTESQQVMQWLREKLTNIRATCSNKSQLSNETISQQLDAVQDALRAKETTEEQTSDSFLESMLHAAQREVNTKFAQQALKKDSEFLAALKSATKALLMAKLLDTEYYNSLDSKALLQELQKQRTPLETEIKEKQQEVEKLQKSIDEQKTQGGSETKVELDTPDFRSEFPLKNKQTVTPEDKSQLLAMFWRNPVDSEAAATKFDAAAARFIDEDFAGQSLSGGRVPIELKERAFTKKKQGLLPNSILVASKHTVTKPYSQETIYKEDNTPAQIPLLEYFARDMLRLYDLHYSSETLRDAPEQSRTHIGACHALMQGLVRQLEGPVADVTAAANWVEQTHRQYREQLHMPYTLRFIQGILASCGMVLRKAGIASLRKFLLSSTEGPAISALFETAGETTNVFPGFFFGGLQNFLDSATSIDRISELVLSNFPPLQTNTRAINGIPALFVGFILLHAVEKALIVALEQWKKRQTEEHLQKQFTRLQASAVDAIQVIYMNTYPDFTDFVQHNLPNFMPLMLKVELYWRHMLHNPALDVRKKALDDAQATAAATLVQKLQAYDPQQQEELFALLLARQYYQQQLTNAYSLATTVTQWEPLPEPPATGSATLVEERAIADYRVKAQKYILEQMQTRQSEQHAKQELEHLEARWAAIQHSLEKHSNVLLHPFDDSAMPPAAQRKHAVYLYLVEGIVAAQAWLQAKPPIPWSKELAAYHNTAPLAYVHVPSALASSALVPFGTAAQHYIMSLSQYVSTKKGAGLNAQNDATIEIITTFITLHAAYASKSTIRALLRMFITPTSKKEPLTLALKSGILHTSMNANYSLPFESSDDIILRAFLASRNDPVAFFVGQPITTTMFCAEQYLLAVLDRQPEAKKFLKGLLLRAWPALHPIYHYYNSLQRSKYSQHEAASLFLQLYILSHSQKGFTKEAASIIKEGFVPWRSPFYTLAKTISTQGNKKTTKSTPPNATDRYHQSLKMEYRIQPLPTPEKPQSTRIVQKRAPLLPQVQHVPQQRTPGLPTSGLPAPPSSGLPAPPAGLPAPPSSGLPAPPAGLPAPPSSGLPAPPAGLPAPPSSGLPAPPAGLPAPRASGLPAPPAGLPVPRASGLPAPPAGLPAPRTSGLPAPPTGLPAPRTSGLPAPPPAGGIPPQDQSRPTKGTWLQKKLRTIPSLPHCLQELHTSVKAYEAKKTPQRKALFLLWLLKAMTHLSENTKVKGLRDAILRLQPPPNNLLPFSEEKKNGESKEGNIIKKEITSPESTFLQNIGYQFIQAPTEATGNPSQNGLINYANQFPTDYILLSLLNWNFFQSKLSKTLFQEGQLVQTFDWVKEIWDIPKEKQGKIPAPSPDLLTKAISTPLEKAWDLILANITPKIRKGVIVSPKRIMSKKAAQAIDEFVHEHSDNGVFRIDTMAIDTSQLKLEDFVTREPSSTMTKIAHAFSDYISEFLKNDLPLRLLNFDHVSKDWLKIYLGFEIKKGEISTTNLAYIQGWELKTSLPLGAIQSALRRLDEDKNALSRATMHLWKQAPLLYSKHGEIKGNLEKLMTSAATVSEKAPLIPALSQQVINTPAFKASGVFLSDVLAVALNAVVTQPLYAAAEAWESLAEWCTAYVQKNKEKLKTSSSMEKIMEIFVVSIKDIVDARKNTNAIALPLVFTGEHEDDHAALIVHGMLLNHTKSSQLTGPEIMRYLLFNSFSQMTQAFHKAKPSKKSGTQEAKEATSRAEEVHERSPETWNKAESQYMSKTTNGIDIINFSFDGDPIKEREQRYYNDTGMLHKDDGPAVITRDTKIWYKNGLRHRTNGPALEGNDGYSAWYINGELHRDNGPAVEEPDGSKMWYSHGSLHRDSGPAVIRGNSKLWYRHGRLHRSDGPAVEGPDGRREWYTNGKRHREFGPAIESAEGYRAWYLDGELIQEETPMEPKNETNSAKAVKQGKKGHKTSLDTLAVPIMQWTAPVASAKEEEAMRVALRTLKENLITEEKVDEDAADDFYHRMLLIDEE